MGFDVKVTPGKPVDILGAERRGLLEAGKAVLEAAVVLAPREPVARHGVHLVDTGFVRLIPGVDEDAVAVGFWAFWADWMHEWMDIDHPYGGTSKFLEIPLVASGAADMEIVAGHMRRELGA